MNARTTNVVRIKDRLLGICLFMIWVLAASPVNAAPLINGFGTLKAPLNSTNFIDNVGARGEFFSSLTSSSTTNAFTTRYASTTGADSPAGQGTNNVTAHSSYQILASIGAATDEKWSLYLNTWRNGELNVRQDGGSTAAAIISEVVASSTGGSLSGSLALPAPVNIGALSVYAVGNEGTAASSPSLAFFDRSAAVLTGVGPSAMTLSFDWVNIAQSIVPTAGINGGDEAAVRLGLPSGIDNFTAGDYLGNRDPSRDGHFVTGALVPDARQVIQMGVIIDGSPSVAQSDFSTIISALSQSIAGRVPDNSRVELTVVQMGGGTGAIEEIMPTFIDSPSTLSAVAADVANISQNSGGGTALDVALDRMTELMTGSAFFQHPNSRQIINVISDGFPNSTSLALDARNRALAAGIDAISAELIGSGGLTFLESLVSPQPFTIAPPFPNPFKNGFVAPVSSIGDFGSVIDTKMQRIFSPIGDFDGNGMTGHSDLIEIIGSLGASVVPGTSGDSNGNGLIDGADLIAASGDVVGSIGPIGTAEDFPFDPPDGEGPEILYDPTTGDVILDTGLLGITGFYFAVDGAFDPTVFIDPFAGLESVDISPFDLGGISLSLTPLTGVHNLGAILPAGLTGSDLNDIFNQASFVGVPGTGTGAFQSMVVPEPSSCAGILLFGLMLSRGRPRNGNPDA